MGRWGRATVTVVVHGEPGGGGLGAGPEHAGRGDRAGTTALLEGNPLMEIAMAHTDACKIQVTEFVKKLTEKGLSINKACEAAEKESDDIPAETIRG